MPSSLDASDRVLCPVPSCESVVLAKRVGDFKALGCEAGHGDASIRNYWIAESRDYVGELRAEMDEIEMRLDPVAWVQDRVLEAREIPDEKFEPVPLGVSDALPSYATGIVGRETGKLLSLHGMTTLSGKASAGKSWFALGAALNSAIDGWDVHYVAAEANDVIRRRVAHVFGEDTPERFNLDLVKPGLTVDHIIGQVAEWVVSTRTLLVFDSVSTIMGLMVGGSGSDKWDAQGRFEMFLLQLRALARGHVGIVNISEANAAGETKGRTLDHRSDVSIHFKSFEDSDAKEIRVVKAWEGRTGLLGRAMVNAEGPGLKLVYEGVRSNESDFPSGPEDF